MATHPSILAWTAPRTEEAGGLQSMGSQRVRHDGVTERVHTSVDPAVFSLSVAQNVRFLFQCLPFISRQNSESVKVISDTA